MKKTKSPLTAGLLGIALGFVGAHDWYSGKFKRALIHVVVFAVGMALLLAGAIVDTSTLGTFKRNWQGDPVILQVLYVLGYFVLFGAVVWGEVEGYIILIANKMPQPDNFRPRFLGDKSVDTQDSAPNSTSVSPITTDTSSGVATGTASVAPAPKNASDGSAHAATAPTTTSHNIASSPVVATPSGTVSTVSPSKSTDPTIKAKSRKKRKIGLSIAAGVIVFLGAGAVVLCIVFHVDYGETYRAARDLRSKLSDVYTNNSCQDVEDFVNNARITNTNYEIYIENCQSFASDKNELINLLGETSGVRKNSEIAQLFSDFQTSYQEALPQFNGLDKRLEIYRAWHNFILLLDDLTASSSKGALESAADVLLQSGSKELTDYADKWLELVLAYHDANEDYWNDPAAGEAELSALEVARDDYNNFLMNDTPDIKEIADLHLEGMTNMFGNFTKLYNAIASAYEEHYDFNSGDCQELYNKKVYCE